MNDHQDSEHFAGVREVADVQVMLNDAERKQNMHLTSLRNSGLTKKQKVRHMRHYKALEGVINSLRWVLGDLKMSRKKVLGDE